jgi:hypothetical protein
MEIQIICSEPTTTSQKAVADTDQITSTLIRLVNNRQFVQLQEI